MGLLTGLVVGWLTNFPEKLDGHLLYPGRRGITQDKCHFLLEAIEKYEEVHQNLPEGLGYPNAYGDIIVPTDYSNHLAEALLGVYSKHNPRGIPFFDAYRPNSPDRGGVQRYSPSFFGITDLWGRPFHVAIDANKDGVVTIPHYEVPRSGDQEARTIKQPIVVWSDGPDRISGDDRNGKSDDIFSSDPPSELFLRYRSEQSGRPE